MNKVLIILAGGCVSEIVTNGAVEVFLLDKDMFKDDTHPSGLPAQVPDEVLTDQDFEARLAALRFLLRDRD